MSSALKNIKFTLSQTFMPKNSNKQNDFFNPNNLKEENNFYSLLKKKHKRSISTIKNNNEIYKCPCCASKLLSQYYKHIHDFSKENNSPNGKQEITELKYQLTTEKKNLIPKQYLYPVISNKVIESNIKLNKEDAHINTFNDYQQIDFNNEIEKNEENNIDNNNKIIGIQEDNLGKIQEQYININEQKNKEDEINDNFKEDIVSENENENRKTARKFKKIKKKKWIYIKVEKMIAD